MARDQEEAEIVEEDVNAEQQEEVEPEEEGITLEDYIKETGHDLTASKEETHNTNIKTEKGLILHQKEKKEVKRYGQAHTKNLHTINTENAIEIEVSDRAFVPKQSHHSSQGGDRRGPKGGDRRGPKGGDRRGPKGDNQSKPAPVQKSKKPAFTEDDFPAL
eukprot:TRINITY_DN20389_c0_g1_i1.p2 TRINITY_DN20389_c0_g1~~TRINITY_DN20389_c0_g1_i1.p2  ORF type:complete len:161 (-),score=34.44 TRINITY_DN20389_c0_g1_i1:21-503(-)